MGSNSQVCELPAPVEAKRLPTVTSVTSVTASCVTITPDNDTGNGQFLVTLNGPVAANTTSKRWDLVG
jgi:hypothetical protein